jgi:hypothetical protein
MTPSGTPKPAPIATSCELAEAEPEVELEELEHAELDDDVVV